MQEKKKLDDMAEKYKEEMMRIYNKKRASEQAVQKSEPEPKPDSNSSETEPDKKIKQDIEPKKHQSEKKCEEASCGDEQPQHNIRDDEKLMHPPMPKIPYENGKAGSGKLPEKSEENCTSEETKFPPAEELISMDCSDDEAGNCSNEEKSVPAANMNIQERPRIPDARFESEGNDPEDTDNRDRHMQGNYNFCALPDAEQENDSGNSEPERHSRQKRLENSAGQGFLQTEVTEQGSGSPVSGAAVVVVRKLGDYDSLEAILTTDSRGMTEAVALDVPDASMGQENDSDSCGEYMITVYKEGFYSVNMLPVPIFDTIKSIQPVELMRVETNCGNM